ILSSAVDGLVGCGSAVACAYHVSRPAMRRVTSLIESVAKGAATTIIFFAVLEILLRGTYAVRNLIVRAVPLPYAFGDDYGPVPPWLGAQMILHPDRILIWRNEPNAKRVYLDIFAPAWTEADRTALLRRFWPTIPAAFSGNPTWAIRL